MIKKVQRAYFEVWGDEQAQNSILKGMLGVLGALFAIQSLVLVVLALRHMPIVAVSDESSAILAPSRPTQQMLESEVTRVVRKYVALHHNWDPESISKNFEQASLMVADGFQKQFLSANQGQLRLSKEKKLAQRFHIAEFKLDSATRTVRIFGDRILIVEGLRAATPMNIEIQYAFQSRSEKNPEGVVIASERTDAQEGAR